MFQFAKVPRVQHWTLPSHLLVADVTTTFFCLYPSGIESLSTWRHRHTGWTFFSRVYGLKRRGSESVKQKAWQLHRHYINTLSSLRDEDQRLFVSITTNIAVHPLHILLPPITRNYSIPIRHIVINFHAKQLHLHFMTIISFIVFYILTFCRMSTHLHCIYTFLFFFTV